MHLWTLHTVIPNRSHTTSISTIPLVSDDMYTNTEYCLTVYTQTLMPHIPTTHYTLGTHSTHTLSHLNCMDTKYVCTYYARILYLEDSQNLMAITPQNEAVMDCWLWLHVIQQSTFHSSISLQCCSCIMCIELYILSPFPTSVFFLSSQRGLLRDSTLRSMFRQQVQSTIHYRFTGYVFLCGWK